MHNYAQVDEHGLIFSVFQSSLPVNDVAGVFETPDYDPLALGCYFTDDGKISSPPSTGSYYVWSESTESFAEIKSSS